MNTSQQAHLVKLELEARLFQAGLAAIRANEGRVSSPDSGPYHTPSSAMRLFTNSSRSIGCGIVVISSVLSSCTKSQADC
jgi:hypothetical protein